MPKVSIIGYEDGLLVVEPILVSRRSGYRLEDGYRVSETERIKSPQVSRERTFP